MKEIVLCTCRVWLAQLVSRRLREKIPCGGISLKTITKNQEWNVAFAINLISVKMIYRNIWRNLIIPKGNKVQIKKKKLFYNSLFWARKFTIYILYYFILSFFCWFLQITCSVCFRSFSRKDSLKRHFLENHLEGRRLFSCDICQKEFKRKHHLQKHIEIAHKTMNVNTVA